MTATLPDAPSVPSFVSTGASANTSRFVWHDLMSTDREAALVFYRGLLGWTVQTLDLSEMGATGEYHMLHAGGLPFGGAVELDESAGVPSHWISYVSCADVDAVADRAGELGGTVGVPPMDIPGVGRFAVVLDPQGAAFSPMTALPGSPSAPESSVDGVVPPGCPIWNELAAEDPEAAASFYAGLLGWGIETAPMEHGGTYTLLSRAAGLPHAGGVFQKSEMVPSSAWIVYFHVTDAAATVAKTGELGGSVLAPVVPVPGIGQVAWLQDPTGAVFAIMEPAWP